MCQPHNKQLERTGTRRRVRRLCVTSLCTRGALDTWPRGRSAAALGDTNSGATSTTVVALFSIYLVAWTIRLAVMFLLRGEAAPWDQYFS
jgi:hypothetical protein